MYYELKKVGERFNLIIDIIGSYAYGLWTPSSDIDIVFINNEINTIEVGEILEKIYLAIEKKKHDLRIKEMYFNEANSSSVNSFPNIKIDIANKKIDITIFQRRNNGRKYVKFISDELARNTLLKPVYYTIHRLLKSF